MPEDNVTRCKPRHLSLLQIAVDNEKSSDEDLARVTGLAESTIHTYWRDILDDLKVDHRADALTTAINLGIVKARDLRGGVSENVSTLDNGRRSVHDCGPPQSWTCVGAVSVILSFKAQ